MPPQEPAHHRHVKAYAALLIILISLIGVAYAAYTLMGGSASGVSANDSAEMSQALANYDTVSAVQAADRVLAQDPNNVAALLAKASSLALQGSLTFQETAYGTQAIALARQALALDPNSYDAWRIIGYSNEIMQNYAAAHDAYAKSLAIKPDYTLAIAQDAHAYDLEGNTVKAEAGYRSALAIDPELDQAELGLGRILAGRNETSDALAIFRKVALSSRSPRTRAEAGYSAGALVSAQGDHAASQALMHRATVDDPSYPLAWVGLASQLFVQAVASSSGATLDEKSTAVQSSLTALQKAISLNSNQTSAYFQLGVELAAFGQKPLAVKTLTHASTVVNSDITLTPAQKTSFADAIQILRTYLSK